MSIGLHPDRHLEFTRQDQNYEDWDASCEFKDQLLRIQGPTSRSREVEEQLLRIQGRASGPREFMVRFLRVQGLGICLRTQDIRLRAQGVDGSMGIQPKPH